LFLCSALANEIADYHEPRCDTDPNLKHGLLPKAEPWDGMDQPKGCSQCALRVVFMGLGVAEIGQRSIPHVLGDLSDLPDCGRRDGGIGRRAYRPRWRAAGERVAVAWAAARRRGSQEGEKTDAKPTLKVDEKAYNSGAAFADDVEQIAALLDFHDVADEARRFLSLPRSDPAPVPFPSAVQPGRW
jgi:hypothetical protein